MAKVTPASTLVSQHGSESGFGKGSTIREGEMEWVEQNIHESGELASTGVMGTGCGLACSAVYYFCCLST